MSLTTLVNLTGASRTCKMPLWPLPPLLALASLGYVFTQQTGADNHQAAGAGK